MNPPRMFRRTLDSNDSKLCALNPNGTLKWSATNGAAVGSSPAIAADGTIYSGLPAASKNNLWKNRF